MSNRTQIPTPSFYNPATVSDVRRVNYADVAAKALADQKAYSVKPAAKDDFRVSLLLIDEQYTFCAPDFELFVDGSVDDAKRVCNFIDSNADLITKIHPTMDTHSAWQVFHSLMFVNDKGEHPNPYDIITASDVANGTWKINPAAAGAVGVDYMLLQQHAVHYTQALEKGGRYALSEWPFHAILGGIGHALISGIEEACFYHNVLRSSQTDFQIKGGNPLTENYSIFAPEVLDTFNGNPIDHKNTKLLGILLDADAVFIAGQAKSHCVAWSIDHLLTEIKAKDPNLAKKVYLLEDCTSPVALVIPGVVDYPAEADTAFARFKSEGMNVVKSTDDIAGILGL